MLIDTHCHVNFNVYKDDAREVIERSLNKDIWLVNVGSQLSTSRRAVEIAEMYDRGVYAIVGLHPIHLFKMHVDEAEQDLDFNTRAESFDFNIYRDFAVHPKVIGIGEMGLDYFHLPAEVSVETVKTKQKELFFQGIKLAQELNLPITIHTRPTPNTFDAYDDVIKVLQQADYFHAVVHCFGGTQAQANELINLGVHLSFTGNVTFKNAKNIHEIAKLVPLDKIMVETDAPYLTPEPYRGKRNEPAYVEFVARKIAEIKGINYQTVAEQTTATSRKFFNL